MRYEYKVFVEFGDDWLPASEVFDEFTLAQRVRNQYAACSSSSKETYLVFFRKISDWEVV